MAMIARWYTNDASNDTRIARINGKNPTDPLIAGDTIVIPNYLVRTKKKLTGEAVKALK